MRCSQILGILALNLKLKSCLHFILLTRRKIVKINEIDNKRFPKRMLAQCDTGGFHLINPAVGNVLTSLILDLKSVIVDVIYSSCENLAIVALDNGNLLKVDTRTNPCKVIQTNRNFPSQQKNF